MTMALPAAIMPPLGSKETLCLTGFPRNCVERAEPCGPSIPKFSSHVQVGLVGKQSHDAWRHLTCHSKSFAFSFTDCEMGRHGRRHCMHAGAMHWRVSAFHLPPHA